MFKRSLTLLLACLMLFPALSAGAAQAGEETPGGSAAEGEILQEEEGETTEETPEFIVDYQHLRVANPTPLTGHFFTSMWGASTSDLDVQELLHRYKIVVYDNELGRYRMNPLVVNGSVIRDDEQGNRTYYISLYSDLEYSDGTPITARDYAFTFLLMVDPAVRDAGGIPTDESWILGIDEYLSGESRTLKGIRVLKDNLLSITVKAESLPYFYELSRLRISPYPISVIAPDSRLLDDGDGVRLAPGLTGATLRRTILDSYQGYMTRPSKVSGPYMIDDYRDGKAHFVLNSRYKGNQKGETPAIPELTYSSAERQEAIDGLRTGEIGLLNKITKAGTIQGIFQLMAEYPERYRMTSYPRMGLTVLRFMPRSPRVQEKEVRQAVFCTMDRESIVRDYTSGFGLPVKGMYGVGQWMVQLLDGPANYPILINEETATPEEVQEYERQLEAWQSMNMSAIPDYTLDPEKAAALLDGNGWNLDRYGDPYTSGVRYKRMEDGTLTGLEMTALIPANLREMLEKHWKPYMERAGFGLELIDREIWDLAEAYRRDSITDCDMVIVGEDFTDKFRLNGGYREFEENQNPAEDTPLEALDNLFDEMSIEVYHTEKTDLENFMRKWLDLQVKMAEDVPVIPMYSNVYFDFYIAELQDYRVENYLGWGNAIVAAWLGDLPEEPDEEEE